MGECGECCVQVVGVVVCCFFFFQAEDGIRDRLVTGVQTCALPIWCHVLEKESFENEEVAALLNEAFICIKVDREEHPDVDQFYMNVVQAMTGRGGWPLTVVMTPDKIPVFGGTYFPREELLKILGSIRSAWTAQPDKIKEVGDVVRKFIEAGDRISTKSVPLDEIGRAHV